MMSMLLSERLFVLCAIGYFLCCAVVSSGQNRYIIRHYTNENGLPGNGIKGIELDKKTGFLWVGTQAGLVRFDGVNFRNFSSENSAVVSRTALIIQNREGTIYCEDDNFSVYRIRGNKPEFVMKDTVFLDPTYIRGGSSPRRPAHALAEKLRSIPRHSFLLNSVVFHEETGDSSSFTFNYFGHACHYDAAGDTLLYFEGDQNFQFVLKLDGHVYFVRENPELWEYNNSTKQLLPAPVENMPDWDEKDEIKPLFIWKTGMQAPLLVYRQNIWELQRVKNTLRLVPVCMDCCPRNADIRSVQIWREQGIIFLGSEANGLYVVKAPFLRSLRRDTTTEAGRAEYAQIEIEPGVVNTASGLSFSADGQLMPGKKRINYPYSNIYRNQEGDCWFSSVNADTIVHFQRRSNQYTRIRFRGRQVLLQGARKMVFAETRGRMYVVSDVGIAEITDDRFRPLYLLPAIPALKNSLNPTAAIEWKPGVLAIAAEQLLFFDTEKRNAPDTVAIPGLIAQVRGLTKYRDYLLIGTYGQGFYLYKNGVVKKMPLDKNGYLSYAHCFMPDDKGFCWISTNRGLFKVSLDALVAAYEKNLDEIYYHYFGKEDGIYNTELNGGCQPCALKLSSGLFSFPSMNGMVIFDPLKPHAPPPSGPVFIEAIYADSIACQPGDRLLRALPYNVRNLRFTIALSQFSKPENVYFSYKLEPYSGSWEVQDITKNNTLLFGGLKPGDYKLHLRIRNGFGPDAFSTTTVSFRILTPWYQQTWFYVLCFAGFVALMWAIVKWRTARVVKREEELQRLVTLQTRDIEQQSRLLEEDNRVKARLIGIISHDIISPIKFIGYLGERMRDNSPSTGEAHRSANLIATMAQNLESLSVNMLNWIRFHHESLTMKKEKFNLYDLVRESANIVATLAQQKGVSFHIDIAENVLVFHYRQIIGIIIYNLAMNAVKHTAAGEIRVTCDHAADHLSLSVIDTGAGMPPDMVELLNDRETIVSRYAAGDAKKYQFGYVIIKDLLRLSDGSMEVTSTLHKGTRVLLNWQIPEEETGNTAHPIS